ncbi:hypothetical protein CRG98_021370, partial [Punica granatum]
MAKESCDSLDSRRIGRAPGSCPAATYLPDPSRLPHRHYYERSRGRWAGELGRACGGLGRALGLGRTRGSRAEGGRVGLGVEAGPNLRAKRVASFGLNPRRSGTGRITLEERAGPNLLGWTCTNQKMGRAREKENTGEDEDGRKGGVRRPRAAVPASERHGDCAGGRGRRRRLLPGLRRARKGRYEARVSWDRGDFRDFGEVSEFSGEGLSSLIAGNSGGSRGGNRGVLLRRVSP